MPLFLMRNRKLFGGSDAAVPSFLEMSYSQADHTPSLAFCIILQHLGGFHGLLQIGNDILGVLEADTEAEEALPVNGRIVG